jgi:peptidoglycan/LPS O-acetylase OafA/YrhL
MKIVRWSAAAALTLISLMDIGVALPGGGNSVPVRVLAPVLGVLGLAAVYGMLRRRHWGAPAALAAGAVNVVSALIAMAFSSEGALTGLVVSLVALALTAAAARTGRASQPQPQPRPRPADLTR